MTTLKSLKKKLKPRRATQTRIAELAGISQGQLNNIIHDRRKVKPEVQEKILNAYKQAWEELK